MKKLVITLNILLMSCLAFGEDKMTYEACLLKSLEGAHSFSLNEVRGLCTEVTCPNKINWSDFKDKDKLGTCESEKIKGYLIRQCNPDINKLTRLAELSCEQGS